MPSVQPLAKETFALGRYAYLRNARSLGGGSGRFSFHGTRLARTDFKRTALRLTLELEWLKVKADYEAAGAPFGHGQGLDIWLEYGQLTTVN